MFEDDEGVECEVGFSFAALERAEAEKLSKALSKVEQRLHSEICAHDDAPSVSTKADFERNYYSEGYDANYESVDDAELRRWQRTFPYLCAAGHTLHHPVEADIANFPDIASNTTSENHIELVSTVLPFEHSMNDLIVVGKAIAIPMLDVSTILNAEHAVEEEVIASDGILEEIIEYNQEGDFTSAPVYSDVPTPEDSIRDEVVSSMLDAVWPDLVTAMKPLIHNVLIAAAENNIPYVLDQAPSSEGQEQGDSWAMEGSDDGFGW